MTRNWNLDENPEAKGPKGLIILALSTGYYWDISFYQTLFPPTLGMPWKIPSSHS
ncbi:hypothetical protein WN55_10579 [Dufourea novaeangliae]|uniref:Uncharacterized protein n=1 Tax=Dufourea novaeangliae TaxID=178035 RepID=A0A154P637_DUFNO|nr:hypothetical protein WN55_10579 [Dufourea novaeangliae]